MCIGHNRLSIIWAQISVERVVTLDHQKCVIILSMDELIDSIMAFMAHRYHSTKLFTIFLLIVNVKVIILIVALAVIIVWSSKVISIVIITNCIETFFQ